MNNINRRIQQATKQKFQQFFDKSKLKIKDFDVKIAKYDKSSSKLALESEEKLQKTAADPAETERPPKLNERESLLPPRIGKVVDNSSV